MPRRLAVLALIFAGACEQDRVANADPVAAPGAVEHPPAPAPAPAPESSAAHSSTPVVTPEPEDPDFDAPPVPRARPASAAEPRVPTQSPWVALGKPQVVGSLDPNIIRRVVRTHIDEVQACYGYTLLMQPNLTGSTQIQFVIDEGGTVTSAKVERVDGQLPSKVAECTALAVQRWSFPKPRIGTVTVVYPFEFMLDRPPPPSGVPRVEVD